MKVLIVDDGDDKVATLLSRFEREGLNSRDIVIANNISHAKSLTRSTQFALAIIDLSVSIAAGGRKQPDNGSEFATWLHNPRTKCKKPWDVIIFTALSDTEITCNSAMSEIGVKIVKYSPGTATGFDLIVRKFLALRRLENSGALQPTSSTCDTVIICALDSPEYTELCSLFPAAKDEHIFIGVSAIKRVEIDNNENERRSIIFASVGRMGSVASCYATTRLVQIHNPKLVIFTGITGGIPGKCKLGDILCATEIINFQGGKVTDGKFIPDVAVAPTSVDSFVGLGDISHMNKVTSQIHDSSHFEAINGLKPSYHRGQMGCSDLVIADDNFIATLKTNYRQMLGVEMEGYGAAYAVNKAGLGIKFILIKCVCDMAGEA